MTTPLLTIAIPTWNRAAYLALNLGQMQNLLAEVPAGTVEILVCENASPDETEAVVTRAVAAGLPITYLRNAVNIGSDANIAQCFNKAAGKYVLILGDDDLLVHGALALLADRLGAKDYGVVTLRAYGYDQDFEKERPDGPAHEREFADAGSFLAAVGPSMTLISGCVINKSLIPRLDASQFCGGNLVQAHLVLSAALAASSNLCVDRYLVACKRNNSGGYDFFRVFVTSFCAVLDAHRYRGLSQQVIDAIEVRFLFSWYPYYLLREQWTHSANIRTNLGYFDRRFRGRWLYTVWVRPIMAWPRPLALAWGAATTFVGRIAKGDLRRGVAFIVTKLNGSR